MLSVNFLVMKGEMITRGHLRLIEDQPEQVIEFAKSKSSKAITTTMVNIGFAIVLGFWFILKNKSKTNT